MRFKVRPAPWVGWNRRGCGRCSVGALVLALGCSTPRPPAPLSSSPPDESAATPESSPDSHPVVAPRPADADPKGWLDASTAQAEATRILAEIAAARSLAVLRNVNVDVVNRTGIRAFAKRAMYESITPAQLRLLGNIQASMGITPRGQDPEQIVLDLLENGVAGFYDPKVKTLFIGDFVDRSTLSMVVGHELAHGLQDMHFDLERYQQPLDHRADEETARRFVIEGGAQATYLAWVTAESGLGSIDDGVLDAMGNQVLDMAHLTSEYPILVRSLQLPYADGTATIVRLVRDKGWSAVDELYERLPESSEQMLHIDKLLVRELPIPVKLDHGPIETLIPASTLVWHDTVGEAELLSMLAQVDASSVARRAAAGWGGDHYVALNRPAPHAWSVPLVIAATVWDSERDAEQFEALYTEYLERMVPDHQIERRKDTVVFATGIPTDIDPGPLMNAAWSGIHVERPRGRGRRRGRKERR